MIKHIGTNPLETPRLLLRRFSPDDAPAMFRNWAGDERVARYMFWRPFQSEESVRAELAEWTQQYARPDFYRWAIVEKDSGSLIGSIGLADFGNDRRQRWEPAYNIGCAFWGHGYTAEALNAVVDYFWDTGAEALYAAHSMNNPASGRVLEKAGFVFRHKDAYQKPDGTLEPANYYRLKRPAPRHVGTRPLETPRLRLRRFTMRDAEAIYHTWAGDEEVTRYMTWDCHENVEETRRIVRGWVDSYQNPEAYEWAMELKETGALIGSIGLHRFQRDFLPDARWEPGYCLARPYWGQGLTTEALLAVMEYFIRCTGIQDLMCCHATANPASGRVMEKAGFVYACDGTFTGLSGQVHPAKFYRYQPHKRRKPEYAR